MIYLGEVEVNSCVYGVQYDDNYIYGGLIFNAGFAEIVKSSFDSVLSLDENLQNVVELLENQDYGVKV